MIISEAQLSISTIFHKIYQFFVTIFNKHTFSNFANLHSKQAILAKDYETYIQTTEANMTQTSIKHKTRQKKTK